MTARNATKSAFVLYPIFAILRRLSAAEDADGKKRETQASKMKIMVRRLLIAIYLTFLAVVVSGCGTTKGQVATEQMVVSDAVDRSVASINFRRLAGKRVYLDTQYMKSVKGVGFVNSDYIISSLRQQMVAAGCRLEEKADDADYIVEARVGALGTDQHDVTYGIPASTALSSAASLIPNAPAIPLIPEIAVAKRNDQVGAAKIAVFAYDRETRAPVWQSGLAKARSTSKDIWLFGAGPFQRGTVHDRFQFAGETIPLPLLSDNGQNDSSDPVTMYNQQEYQMPEERHGPDPMTMYGREVLFVKRPPAQPAETESAGTVAQPASLSKEAAPAEQTASKPEPPTEKK